MTGIEVLYEAKTAISLTFFLSMPIVLAATVVGLTVALLQTVIQLQEQTLGFAAKFTACVLTFVVVGEWMSNELVSYISQIFDKISMS